MPERIQRRRTKGWRLPAGAVCVTRETRWGNSWRVGSTDWTVDPGGIINREPHAPLTRAQAVESFRNSEEAYVASMTPDERQEFFEPIRGRDLACWCPLDQPCHADVLLEIANR